MTHRKGQTRKQKVATRGHKDSKGQRKLKKMVAAEQPEPKDITDQIVEASKFDPKSVVNNILKKKDGV